MRDATACSWVPFCLSGYVCVHCVCVCQPPFCSLTSPVRVPGRCRPVVQRKASLCQYGTDRPLLHSWLPLKPWPTSRSQNQARPRISVVHPRQRASTQGWLFSQPPPTPPPLRSPAPSTPSQTGLQQSTQPLMVTSIPSIDPNEIFPTNAWFPIELCDLLRSSRAEYGA